MAKVHRTRRWTTRILVRPPDTTVRHSRLGLCSRLSKDRHPPWTTTPHVFKSTVYWYVLTQKAAMHGIVVARFGTTHPGNLVVNLEISLALVLWVQSSVRIEFFFSLTWRQLFRAHVIAWVATFRRESTRKERAEPFSR